MANTEQRKTTKEILLGGKEVGVVDWSDAPERTAEKAAEVSA
jgi:predicted CoA-binding protein